MPAEPPFHVVEDEPDDGGDDLDFDLDALRKAPHQMFSVETALLSIPVRKPKTDEFFRTHIDESYVQDLPLLQVELNDRKELYWVTPSYRAAVADRIVIFRTFACINRAKTVFLWPISLSDAAVVRRWRESALTIAEEARKAWVTKTVAEGAYGMGIAKADLGEPEWPEMTFVEMIKMAFKSDDRTIRDGDHHVIRLINGEV